MKKTLRLYITLKVRTIFFNSFVKENAEKLNLKGFVRNLDDGRVEVFIEGPTSEVQKMTELCSKGPKNVHVLGVEVKDEKFQDLKGFKILHI